MYIFVSAVFNLLLHEVSLSTSVSESLLFLPSLPGQIMTSIVIQFVRLVAPFTRLEKVVNCNRKVQATKFINNEASINGVHQLNDEIKNIFAE